MLHPLNAPATPIFIQSYKIPISRRSTESYKKKESLFTTSLDVLFDIAQQNYWEKRISNTAGHVTRNAVQKKLARKKKALSYTLAQTAGPSSSTGTSSTPASPHCSPTSTDVDELVPKRACTTTLRSTGTSVTIPRDILKRLDLQLTVLVFPTNKLLEYLLALSTIVGETLMMSPYPPLQPETLEQQQEKKQHPISRKHSPSQINFDGKLLQEFGGTEKVNRLAVVAIQEEENQLLCVTKTVDSTGRNDSLLF